MNISVAFFLSALETVVVTRWLGSFVDFQGRCGRDGEQKNSLSIARRASQSNTEPVTRLDLLLKSAITDYDDGVCAVCTCLS